MYFVLPLSRKWNIMSFTERVVKAGHTDADLLNFGSVTGWWTFWAASVFIMAWMGDVQYHGCGHFHLCLLFTVATLSILKQVVIHTFHQ